MENITIREFKKEDYEGAYALWQTIHGFGIRSVDDSYEGVIKFLERNPGCSVLAETADGRIIGTILCGHDGRRASFYHVCVHEDFRRHGIGKQMVVWCMQELKKLKVNKISLVAFKKNELGNNFWHGEGWTERDDLNMYDFVLNEENITRFNK